jgi:hypothetical protein
MYDKVGLFGGSMRHEELFIRATRKTPEVLYSEGRFLVEGRSIPENAGDFYRPLYAWFNSKFAEAGERPLLEFAFDYINTASAKWIFLILRDLLVDKKEYKLVWYYEKGDEDMLDLGLMFRNLLGCSFAAIEVDGIPYSGRAHAD